METNSSSSVLFIQFSTLFVIFLLKLQLGSIFVFLQGETAVASSTNCPEWNEEISFIEQFPPLAQRIRVQILDDAKTGDVALATHFLDLQQISDPTRNGTLWFPAHKYFMTVGLCGSL